MKFELRNKATKVNTSAHAASGKRVGESFLVGKVRAGHAVSSGAKWGSEVLYNTFRPLYAGGDIAARCPYQKRGLSAYTLIEVLAALLLLAIVVPVAIEALHTASIAGEVAARKGEAARVADDVLNRSIITTNWNSGVQNGTINDGGHQFAWTLNSQTWPVDSTMELLTAQVRFSIQGRDYSVQSSTLARSQSQNLTTGFLQ